MHQKLSFATCGLLSARLLGMFCEHYVIRRPQIKEDSQSFKSHKNRQHVVLQTTNTKEPGLGFLSKGLACMYRLQYIT